MRGSTLGWTTWLTVSCFVSVAGAQQAPAPDAAPAMPPAGQAAAAAPRAAAAQPAPAQVAPAQVAPAQAGPKPPAAAPGAAGNATTDAASDSETSNVELRDAPTFADPISQALEPVGGGLTANEVAKRSIASSDTIAAKHAQIEAAAAQVDQAIARFFPQLTLTATYTRLSDIDNSLGDFALVGAGSPGVVGSVCADPADATTCMPADSAGNPLFAAPMSFPTILNNYSLKASLAVPISDYILRLSDSIATTEHNEEAARLNEQAEHRKVEADSRIAFYNWTRGLGQVAVAGKSLERIQARLKDAQTAYELGSATRADVLRLEALVASTESAIVQAEAFRDLVAAQLSTMMDDKNSSYTLGEAVMTPLPPPRGTDNLQNLISEASAKRPELKAISESSEALRLSAKVMRRGQWPRLDAFGEYNYANPNQRRFPSAEEWTGTWAVGASLTWHVNDTFNNGAVASELDAQRKGVEAQQRALREGIRLEVTNAFLEDRKARAALAAAQRGTESARAAYEVATELYRVGRATTTELIDAEAELVGALLSLVNAYIDLRVSSTKLAYVTGRDLMELQ